MRESDEALRHGARLPDPIQELVNPLAHAVQKRRGLPEQVIDCESSHDDVVSFSNRFVHDPNIVWYYIDFTVPCCMAAI